MGGGIWSHDDFSARERAKRAAGKSTFDYSDTVHRTGIYKVHPDLDPFGVKVRECRDSDEHPESLPIAVIFDVTGSMGQLPKILQGKLGKLHDLLIDNGYAKHPEILFGAVGDAWADRLPLQIGQFESDNRMDENLENIVLEGGGGGGNHESYNLAAYFMANHTVHDAWEKRKKKGYLFLIGDEQVYDSLHNNHVAKIIGDKLDWDLNTKQVFQDVRKTYDVYFLFASQGSYDARDVLAASSTRRGAYGWREVLGENAVELDDAAAVCETIAMIVGLGESVASFDSALDDLRDVGTDHATLMAVGKALSGKKVVGLPAAS